MITSCCVIRCVQVNSTALFVAALAQLLKEKPASASNFDILHAGGMCVHALGPSVCRHKVLIMNVGSQCRCELALEQPRFIPHEPRVAPLAGVSPCRSWVCCCCCWWWRHGDICTCPGGAYAWWADQTGLCRLVHALSRKKGSDRLEVRVSPHEDGRFVMEVMLQHLLVRVLVVWLCYSMLLVRCCCAVLCCAHHCW